MAARTTGADSVPNGGPVRQHDWSDTTTSSVTCHLLYLPLNYCLRREPPGCRRRVQPRAASKASIDLSELFHQKVGPHRGIGRKTTAAVYGARDKPVPSPSLVKVGERRLRFDRVDKAGRITLRHPGTAPPHRDLERLRGLAGRHAHRRPRHRDRGIRRLTIAPPRPRPDQALSAHSLSDGPGLWCVPDVGARCLETSHWSGRRDSNPRPSPWQGRGFRPSGSGGSPEVRFRPPGFHYVQSVRCCSRALNYRLLALTRRRVPFGAIHPLPPK